MPIVDAFNTDTFSMVSLTTAINKLPFMPSRVGQLGVFAPQGIATTTAVIEERDGLLTLLSTKPRGAPSQLGKAPKRKARSFIVPHIPYDDALSAEDIQNVRAFGSETRMQTLSQLVNDRMTQMRQDHEVTLEHLRIGALKGVILDADGVTVLFNLFTEFSVTQIQVDFLLGTAGTRIKLKCLEVKRAIELELGVAPTLGVRALCGKDFFEKLITHAKVEAAYERWQAGNFFREDQRTMFQFAGIQFEEYVGSVSGVDFVKTNSSVMFPIGVPNLYKTYFAPADFMETVNTIGRPIYAKQEAMEMNRGVKLHTQSNPLPLCHRPGVLIDAITSN